MQTEDAIDSLLEEMWAQQGYEPRTETSKESRSIGSHKAKSEAGSFNINSKRQIPELKEYPDNKHLAGNHSIWNPYVESELTSAGQIRKHCDILQIGRIPTNPQSEVIRRRAFEKFKQESMEVLQEAQQKWEIKLPIPAILEKWHMDSKLNDWQLFKARSKDKDFSSDLSSNTNTFPLIGSTEEVYQAIMKISENRPFVDPILPAKQSAKLLQAVLEPEVIKAWKTKVNFLSKSLSKDQKAGASHSLPKKAGKKFQHIQRIIYKKICEAHQLFQQQLQQAIKTEHHISSQSTGRRRKLPKLHKDNERDCYQTTYAGLSFKVHTAYFEKLQRLFDRAQIGNASSSFLDVTFEEALFCLLCRYDTLQGAGLQAGVPGRVMDELLDYFDCRMECFASPLNCRYENFCSVFEIDCAFGGLGSFFDLDDDFFEKNGGCFEANPPFCEGVIEAMNVRFHDLLSLESSKALMFVVFVPAWKESKAYQKLINNPFMKKHVMLENGKHWYAEGTQHRRKESFRLASFDTSVLFYQNNAALERWPVTQLLLQSLKAAFCDNPGQMTKFSGISHQKSSNPTSFDKIVSKQQKMAQKEIDPTARSKKRKASKKKEGKRKKLDSSTTESESQIALLNSLGL